MNGLVKMNKRTGATVVHQDDNVTVLRMKGTVYGSSEEKDAVGEYFTPDTDFGNPAYNKKTIGLYEHGINAMINPHNKGQIPAELGVVTLVDPAEAPDNLARWWDYEISRSHVLHDLIVGAAKNGWLGASTGCARGTKVVDQDGRITQWKENERSVTVEPADIRTIPTVEEYLSSAPQGVKTAIVEYIKSNLAPKTEEQPSDVEDGPSPDDVPNRDSDVDEDAIAELEAALADETAEDTPDESVGDTSDESVGDTSDESDETAEVVTLKAQVEDLTFQVGELTGLVKTLAESVKTGFDSIDDRITGQVKLANTTNKMLTTFARTVKTDLRLAADNLADDLSHTKGRMKRESMMSSVIPEDAPGA